MAWSVLGGSRKIVIWQHTEAETAADQWLACNCGADWCGLQTCTNTEGSNVDPLVIGKAVKQRDCCRVWDEQDKDTMQQVQPI